MMKIIEKSKGCYMSLPDGFFGIKHILGFVDDKREYANDWFENLLPKSIKRLHTTAKSWEKLLFISAGKLEMGKYAVL